MREEKVYIAEDGTKFDRREDCLAYENVFKELSYYKMTYREGGTLLILMPKASNANLIYMLFGYNHDLKGELYNITPSSEFELSKTLANKVIILEGDTELNRNVSDALEKYAMKKNYHFIDHSSCYDWIEENKSKVLSNCEGWVDISEPFYYS